jgi:hypothetical protein
VVELFTTHIPRDTMLTVLVLARPGFQP